LTVQPTQKLVAGAVLALIVLAVTASIAALAALSSSKSLQSYGTVKTVNVGVYWNSGCTNATSTVNWGVLSPGKSSNVTLYVRNEGSTTVRLSLSTQNWSPVNAPDYLGMSWNRETQSVAVGTVVAAVLTISVSSNITGITNFSFDIVIAGIEQ
jgi:hypothetical protein